MACNITDWSINQGTSQIYVGSGVQNTLQLNGSGFTTTAGVTLTAPGYVFSNVSIDPDISTANSLLINFQCDSGGMLHTFYNGDLVVTLTNPDCTTTCVQQAFVVPAQQSPTAGQGPAPSP